MSPVAGMIADRLKPQMVDCRLVCLFVWSAVTYGIGIR